MQMRIDRSGRGVFFTAFGRAASFIAAVSLLIFSAAVKTPAQAAADYKIATGDRIGVTVVGQTELSGDFTVDDTGSITFPLIGAVEVRGQTVALCQQRLIERLADGYLAQPSIFVRIVELRPVQVIGDVRNPGSFPYRYGAIVKSFVGLAGGVGDARIPASIALVDQLQAVERVRLIQATRTRLTLSKARLEAQRADAENFSAPERQTNDNAEEYRVALDDEQKAFELQTSALRRQLELIRSQIPSMRAESAAIDSQIVSERKQIGLVNEQLDAYQKMAKNGLMRAETMLQLQLGLASKESNVWRLEADLSRLKVTIGEIAIRLQDAENIYKRQVLTDLQDVTRRLLENNAAEPTAKEILAVKSDTSIGRANSLRSIVITRIRDDNVTLVSATEESVVEPGDVIEVKTVSSFASAPSPADGSAGGK